MDNPIIIEPLSSLCRSPSPLIYRLVIERGDGIDNMYVTQQHNLPKKQSRKWFEFEWEEVSSKHLRSLYEEWTKIPKRCTDGLV